MRSIQAIPSFQRRTILLGMIGSVAHLTGCGGGSDVAGLSSGGTGSFTTGTISGLGSIIVNGIRYNDDNASVISRDDGTSFGKTLQVGMVVSIQGTAVVAAASVANKISCSSEWEGPVASVGTTSFNMFGLTVDVLASTVFEGAATELTGLTTSHFVEVHGYVDPSTGHLQATRVDVSASQPTQYKLSGVVNSFSASSQTFKLGSTTQSSSQISWDNSTSRPTSASDGVFVRVTMTPWLLATQIRLETSPLTQLGADDEQDAEVHGFITVYQSNASFTVNGIEIDASSAPNTGGTLALGVQVQVKGRLSNGIVIATHVETPSDASLHEFEFHGTVSALNPTAQTFVLHGLTLTYDSSTIFQGVTLANGTSVEVKTVRSSGTWLATTILSGS